MTTMDYSWISQQQKQQKTYKSMETEQLNLNKKWVKSEIKKEIKGFL